MKTKKHGVFALAAVLIVTVALVTSCPEPLGPGGISATRNNNVSEKSIGSISLRIDGDGITIGEFVPAATGGDGQKTILPTGPISSINHYAVVGTVATVDDDGTTSITPTGTAFSGNIVGSVTGNIGVDVGVYKITVTAYLDGTTTKLQPVGTGTYATNITVVDPGGWSGTINLLPMTVAAGQTGAFDWDIVLPTLTNAPDTATMTLKPYNSNGTTGAAVLTVNLLSAAVGQGLTGSESDIDSGNYQVTVTLSKAGHADTVKGDLVHIRQNMTTEYSDTFGNLTPDTYAIRYYNIDNNGTNNFTQTAIKHGSLLTPPTPANALTDGKTFGGWFTENTFQPANEWIVATSVVYKATDLYAKWNTPPITVGLTITFIGSDITLLLDDGLGSTTNIVTFSKANLETANYEATFELDDTTDLTSVIWKYGDTILTDATTLGTLVLDMTDLDTNIALLVAGKDYDITVYVVKGSNTYSGNFILRVTN